MNAPSNPKLNNSIQYLLLLKLLLIAFASSTFMFTLVVAAVSVVEHQTAPVSLPSSPWNSLPLLLTILLLSFGYLLSARLPKTGWFRKGTAEERRKKMLFTALLSWMVIETSIVPSLIAETSAKWAVLTGVAAIVLMIAVWKKADAMLKKSLEGMSDL